MHVTVEPIRDRKAINTMCYYLKGKDPKYGLLFKFGLNTGLRKRGQPLSFLQQ